MIDGAGFDGQFPPGLSTDATVNKASVGHHEGAARAAVALNATGVRAGDGVRLRY